MKIILKLSFLLTFLVGILESIETSNPIVSHQEKGTSFGMRVEAYKKSRKAHPDHIFDFLKNYISKDELVLDVACGTGLSTAPLFARFTNVRGSDIDPRMLEEAKKLDPTRFDLADVYNLPYSNETFGLVTAFNAFHWFCDQKAVNEIARVLKSKGYFYPVTSKPFKDPLSIRGKVNKVIENIIGVALQDSKTNFHPEEMLTQNGFEIVYTNNTYQEHKFTPEEFLIKLKSSGDSWGPVIKAGKEQEVIPLIKEVLQANTDADGMITDKATINVILAKKKS